jgi:ketosteroid isomerase-like protein
MLKTSRSGDLGCTSGTTENTFKDASGKTATFKGKYLTVGKKQADGSRFERGERFGWLAEVYLF